MTSQFANTIRAANHLIIPPLRRRFCFYDKLQPFINARTITFVNWSNIDIADNVSSYYFPNAKQLNFLWYNSRTISNYRDGPSGADLFYITLALESYPNMGAGLKVGVESKYIYRLEINMERENIIPISYFEKRRLLKDIKFDTLTSDWRKYLESHR